MQFKIRNFNAREDEIIRGSQSIEGAINRLKVGKAATPRSWFYEKKSPDTILQEVKSIVDDYDGPGADILKQFEESYIKKYLPQGGVPAWNEELAQLVKDSYIESVQQRPLYKSAIWNKAKQVVIRKLKLHGQLKLWSYDKTLSNMQLKGTESKYAGWPTGGKKKDPAVFAKACRDADNGAWRDYPAILMFRSYKAKIRMIWMYPYATTLKELSFVNPLMEHIQSLNLFEFQPWKGFDYVKQSLNHVFDDGMVYGGDSKRMDNHFGLPCSMEVFDVIKHGFNPGDWDLLKELLIHMHEIPIVTPDGMYTGQHGVSSGSGFTSLCETIHDMIIYEAAKLKSPEVSKGMFIGDDYINKMLKVKKWASFWVALYLSAGLPGQLEKQSDDPDSFTFCQRISIKSYQPFKDHCAMIYSAISWARTNVWPENYIDPEDYSSDMYFSKLAMTSENLVDHPKFRELMIYAARSQKDVIRTAKQSARKLDKIWAKARVTAGIGESYNQEKQDKPLKDYACVKIWASL